MTSPIRPPDGGFGWVVVLAAFLQHVISIGIAYTIGVYYPFFVEKFNLSPATAAWVAALHFSTFFGMGPVSGWLTNKIGTSAVSFSGSVIAGLACTAAAFSSSIYVVIISFGLIAGIGTGFMFMAAVTAVSRWFEKKRPLATGIAVSGAGVGIFAFAPFLRLLINHYGGEGALLIEGGLAFQGCVFALLLRPIPAKRLRRRKNSFNGNPNMQINSSLTTSQDVEAEAVPLKERQEENGDTDERKSVLSTPELTMRGVFGSWIFWVFALSQLLTFISSMGPLVFLYNRAIKDLAVEPMQASYVLSMLGVANTGGRLIFGAIANRFPTSSLYLLSGAIMSYGLATAVSVLGTSFWSIALFAVVFGAGYGCMFALTTVVLVDLFGIRLFGPIYGNIGMFRGLASVVGPPFAGWLITVTGNSHTTLFILKGFLGFFGGALLLAIPIFRSSRLQCRKS